MLSIKFSPFAIHLFSSLQLLLSSFFVSEVYRSSCQAIMKVVVMAGSQATLGIQAAPVQNARLRRMLGITCSSGITMNVARYADLYPDEVDRIFMLCPSFGLATRVPKIASEEDMKSWERDGARGERGAETAIVLALSSVWIALGKYCTWAYTHPSQANGSCFASFEYTSRLHVSFAVCHHFAVHPHPSWAHKGTARLCDIAGATGLKSLDGFAVLGTYKRPV